jgi:hypothetical protein
VNLANGDSIKIEYKSNEKPVNYEKTISIPISEILDMSWENKGFEVTWTFNLLGEIIPRKISISAWNWNSVVVNYQFWMRYYIAFNLSRWEKFENYSFYFPKPNFTNFFKFDILENLMSNDENFQKYPKLDKKVFKQLFELNDNIKNFQNYIDESRDMFDQKINLKKLNPHKIRRMLILIGLTSPLTSFSGYYTSKIFDKTQNTVIANQSKKYTNYY